MPVEILSQKIKDVYVCFLVLATYWVPVSALLRTKGEVWNNTSPALLSTCSPPVCWVFTSQEETSQTPEKAWWLSVSNQSLEGREKLCSTATTLHSCTQPLPPDLVVSPRSRWYLACMCWSARKGALPSAFGLSLPPPRWNECPPPLTASQDDPNGQIRCAALYVVL